MACLIFNFKLFALALLSFLLCNGSLKMETFPYEPAKVLDRQTYNCTGNDAIEICKEGCEEEAYKWGTCVMVLNTTEKAWLPTCHCFTETLEKLEILDNEFKYMQRLTKDMIL